MGKSLGIHEILWLEDGLDGDDTDGHIDNIARFFEAERVLVAVADSKDFANKNQLEANLKNIQDFRTGGGESFEVVELPLPEPIHIDGEKLIASYLNYVVLNGAVLVPTFGQSASDARAISIIEDCFPDRVVEGVDCREIAEEGGALHCMSLNQFTSGSFQS